ncbi:MAG: NAD(P)/FAD-dependent oxidoreductase [Taibaiella sp.]|nr:NAD(P)/FAD-dependent oxidoreductase [Taibaiella sp.]
MTVLQDDQSSVKASHYNVIIIGGGLAGLICAINLSASYKVLLIEKHTYPFHKVCGEYISNEVLPYLISLGFDPYAHGAVNINKLRVSTPSGRNFYAPLDLGGFGISRYTIDNELAKLAAQKGCEVMTGTRVNDVQFGSDIFIVKTNKDGIYTAPLVIGSYGKRDALDKRLDRGFINKRTRYMGVKYHVRMDYPVDEIGLDNFEGGYCGMSKIEGNDYNICYLYKRQKVNFRSIKELEEKVLYKNPHLKKILTEATYVREAPEVINEICFSPKTLVEDHILMCGDTAGLITPLCGNGMSMAIGAAKILSALILKTSIEENKPLNKQERAALESNYIKQWKQMYGSRLVWGRVIQVFFGNKMITEIFTRSVHAIRPLRNWLIRRTHGRVITN